jgi:hypothetical protein
VSKFAQSSIFEFDARRVMLCDSHGTPFGDGLDRSTAIPECVGHRVSRKRGICGENLQLPPRRYKTFQITRIARNKHFGGVDWRPVGCICMSKIDLLQGLVPLPFDRQYYGEPLMVDGLRWV